MIVTCISDLHGSFPITPGGDLLIIAGDLTVLDSVNEHFNFLKWLNEQRYRKKVYIAGNHDNFCKKNRKIDRHHKKWEPYIDNMDYLQDSGTEFEGFKIWGSPWTENFVGVNPCCTAFMIDEPVLESKWALIPNDIDILITHSPPKGILDNTERKVRVGSESLLKKVKKIKPYLHVFGHIHEGYGVFEDKNTVYINAAHMDCRYLPVNFPYTIEISKE